MDETRSVTDLKIWTSRVYDERPRTECNSSVNPSNCLLHPNTIEELSTRIGTADRTEGYVSVEPLGTGVEEVSEANWNHPVLLDDREQFRSLPPLGGPGRQFNGTTTPTLLNHLFVPKKTNRRGRVWVDTQRVCSDTASSASRDRREGGCSTRSGNPTATHGDTGCSNGTTRSTR